MNDYRNWSTDEFKRQWTNNNLNNSNVTMVKVVKKLLETMMATTNMVQELMNGKISMNNATKHTITTTIAKEDESYIYIWFWYATTFFPILFFFLAFFSLCTTLICNKNFLDWFATRLCLISLQQHYILLYFLMIFPL